VTGNAENNRCRNIETSHFLTDTEVTRDPARMVMARYSAPATSPCSANDQIKTQSGSSRQSMNGARVIDVT
jgi:hypothetical protein